ncbi:Formate hydrogenlyase transcriptional activator [Minicystis rosea]|nr:Formate hydrogenlyase transcriptional activator [Minicystis rosea]
MQLAAFLRTRKEQILLTWEQTARKNAAAKALSRAALRDHIPELLDNIVRALEQGLAPTAPAALGHAPDIHAIERLGAGFDLDEVVAEYRLFRASIFQLWSAEPAASCSIEEVMALDEVIDRAIGAAVERYASARQRTLQALDSITVAAFGTGDLDGFLAKLIRVLLETVETVETVAILVREGDRLCVRAAMGLDEPLRVGYSLGVGEGFAGTIAAERRPILVHDVAHDPLVKSEALRAENLRVLYGVPIVIDDGEVLGVAHMGSRQTDEFSEEDKLLLQTMASRAAAILVQKTLEARVRTARAQAEQRAADLDMVMSGAPVGLALLDRELRYRRVNEHLAAMNGRSPEAHLGRTVRDVLPGLNDMFEQLFQRVLETDAPIIDYEFTGRRPGTGDEERWWRGSYYPVRDNGGQIIGFGVVVADISEQKWASDELRRTKQRIELVLQSAGEGIYGLDADGRTTFVNAAAVRMTEWSAEDLIGKLQHAKTHHSHADGTSYPLEQCPIHATLRDGATRHREDEVFWRRDGRCFPVEYTSTAIPEDGRPVGAVVVFRDITERRKAEEEQRREATFRERFIGVLGHDLRTPLSAIVLSADMLLRSERLPEEVVKPLRRMATSAQRMERMIADLLDFARSREGGGIPLSVEPVDLAALCESVVDEVGATSPDRVIELTTHGACHGHCDPHRMAQAMQNLLVNALGYSPPETPVEVEVGCSDDQLRIRVSNGGAPIPPEVLPVLFEPFRRGMHVGAPQRGSQGLGLGLFIVKQIVEAHGGAIEMSSEAGRGTSFILLIPRRPRH